MQRAGGGATQRGGRAHQSSCRRGSACGVGTQPVCHPSASRQHVPYLAAARVLTSPPPPPVPLCPACLPAPLQSNPDDFRAYWQRDWCCGTRCGSAFVWGMVGMDEPLAGGALHTRDRLPLPTAALPTPQCPHLCASTPWQGARVTPLATSSRWVGRAAPVGWGNGVHASALLLVPAASGAAPGLCPPSANPPTLPPARLPPNPPTNPPSHPPTHRKQAKFFAKENRQLVEQIIAHARRSSDMRTEASSEARAAPACRSRLSPVLCCCRLPPVCSLSVFPAPLAIGCTALRTARWLRTLTKLACKRLSMVRRTVYTLPFGRCRPRPLFCCLLKT